MLTTCLPLLLVVAGWTQPRQADVTLSSAWLGGLVTSHGQRESAVRSQGRSRDVTGLIRAQEDNGLSNLLRATGAPKVNAREHRGIVHLVAEQLSRAVMHRRVNDPWAYEVHADSVRRQLRGHARRQSDQAVL